MNLYCIRIKNNRQHPEYATFYKAMSNMNGKHPDYGGSMNGALVKHHMDEKTVRAIVTAEMNYVEDIEIIEVTNKTLEGILIGYIDLVEKYFMPHDDYPKIST